ncbi:response regulator transcription factor [Thalassobacillus devorans]|uniref:response regulator transcription factor n=1 Tax=Thalassobacillus devorans TaxID=279813 RepID=UPI0004B32DA3|nr:response regulator [Thalassobacillus devorans]
MKVLVADDEQLERKVLKLIIKKENLDISQVYTAENGAEAIKQVRKESIDLLLMDIKMPVMDGLMAAKIIKRDFPDCRIIFLTAYDEFDFAYQSIKLGVEDYLLKPAQPSEVKKALMKYIPEANHPLPITLEDSCSHVQSVINYIEENLHLNISIETLAEFVHLSSQYLSRLFKQETGFTITQYITIKRLDKAKEYLRSNQNTVMEISEKCGFTDSNYFARVFKKYEGITPTQYQHQSLMTRKKKMNSFNNFVM